MTHEELAREIVGLWRGDCMPGEEWYSQLKKLEKRIVIGLHEHDLGTRVEELERENALLREGCLEIAKRCDNLLILLNKRNAELSKLYRRLNRVTGS